LDNLVVHSCVTTGVDVINGCLEDTNDTTNLEPIDAVAGNGISLHEHSANHICQVYEDEFNLKGKESLTIFFVNVVDGEFRTGEKMSQSSIMPDENEILLAGGEKIIIRFLVLPLGSERKVPDGHEETIVRSKVCMVSKVEFGGIEKVSDGRPLASPDRICDANIHVTEGIDEIE